MLGPDPTRSWYAIRDRAGRIIIRVGSEATARHMAERFARYHAKNAPYSVETSQGKHVVEFP